MSTSWHQETFDDFAAAQATWTVGEVTRRLRRLLETGFGRLRVRGQVTNLSRPKSGHLYFSLVDDGGGASSRFTSAQLPVVVWRSTAADLPFRPEDGMKVIASGELTAYEPRGVYQLVADGLEVEGIGDLHAAFERLKERLAAEGLFAQDRKRPLPGLPRCIGLITSPTGAAVRDFLRVLFERNPSSRVRLVPVRVQGEGAAEEIARALELLQAPPAQVDAIVLTRGGGSLEDLWAFNEERVARALARSAVPTLSAVGHEVDFTIADFVADVRAPTPTAAAACVMPDRRELTSRLDGLRRRLVTSLRTSVHDGRSAILRCAAARAFREPQLITEKRVELLDEGLERLENHLYKRLREWHDSLALLGERLRGLSPFAVLERGYSVTLHRSGRIVRRVEELSPGDEVAVRFQDGVAHARVEDVAREAHRGR